MRADATVPKLVGELSRARENLKKSGKIDSSFGKMARNWNVAAAPGAFKQPGMLLEQVFPPTACARMPIIDWNRHKGREARL